MQNVLTYAQTVLTSTPERWLNLAKLLPADLLRLPAAPGEWSALECLQHLVDTERWVFPVRVQYFLNGQDFPAFDPDTQGSQLNGPADPAGLAAEFDLLRHNSLAVLAKIKPDDLQRSAGHQELGAVTLGEMLHEWAGHDLMHTVQAERALMQPFIQGSGAWQVYFKDHIA